MRLKIIIVNGGIVLIVGLLSYFLLMTSLADIVANPQSAKADAERSIRSANARLELDALQTERWLAGKAQEEATKNVFSLGTASARSEAATAQANKLRDAAVGQPTFAKMAPSLVVFVDAQGVAVGRNGSALMRGDKLGETYPALLTAVKGGQTMSDVWLGKQQLLASYAPVRGEEGKIVGLVVMGTPLNDERLTRTSDQTSGRALMLATQSADKFQVVAKSGSAQQSQQDEALGSGVAKTALTSGNVSTQESGQNLYAAAPLSGYGKQQAVLVAGVPASLVPSLSGLLWPVLAVAGLGIVLVVVGGMLLANYISNPISEIEEGLLQVINGNAQYRFELEHAELGGLVHRLNSLLNALMGVPETDEDGRPSAPPGQDGGGFG